MKYNSAKGEVLRDGFSEVEILKAAFDDVIFSLMSRSRAIQGEG